MEEVFEKLVERDGKACAFCGKFSAEMGEARGDLTVMRRNSERGDEPANLVLVDSTCKRKITGYMWYLGYIHGVVTGDDPALVPLNLRHQAGWMKLDNDWNRELYPVEDFLHPRKYAEPAK